jgi:hypothetical protein
MLQAIVCLEPLGQELVAVGAVTFSGVTLKAALVPVAVQAPVPTAGR